RRPRDFYNTWISALVTKEPAVVIVDDKRASEFIHEISDRHFGLILFLHGTHLRHPWNGKHGQILPRRVETMRNFDRFDIVGVQTEQQADAIRAMGLPGDNIRLLTGELPAGSILSDSPIQRPVHRAVMIANLIELKRVDHPIRAVAKLRGRGIDVSLTVLGEGPERRKLEKLIDVLDVGDLVELPGYVTDVQERLQSTSFCMLTSTSEGLPLSLMESMGAGCVPIVYDITYGPRDLIDQGENGFITPWGDIGPLAHRIESLLCLQPEDVNAMRKSAMTTVERYLPEVGYGRWKRVLEELRPAKRHDDRNGERVQPVEAKKIKCEPISRGTRVEVELDQTDPSIAETLELVFAARSLNTFFTCRNIMVSSRRRGRRIALTFEVEDEKFSESSGGTFDVYLRRNQDLWA